ncbi:uncharacterized protein LOC110838304 isoform X2 [Zootermopsis nevadensis]|uniref:uncharacterized protein LOC110838304 isoform X2 n=1 Tax=Zootermopsis nevadensis TaxID=136037 RepID=UPI000B8E740B|nr:uncharacterized protein LOC110838304 isoform X2 [Zootermopsis nevadensis]
MGVTNKTWSDVDDVMTRSDCDVMYGQLYKEKGRYRQQDECYTGKSNSKNLKQILSKFNTPRRNPKRMAATVSLKRFQSYPFVNTKRSKKILRRSVNKRCRTDLSEELLVSGPARRLAPSAVSLNQRSLNTNHKPRNTKFRASRCSVTQHTDREGCVLEPPTTQDAFQMREWPAEGMHERPVWPDPRLETPKFPSSELEISVHNSLHAVMAFAAQVGRNVSEGDTKPINTYVCLDDELGDVTFTEDQLNDLENLVINTGLLYCAVCSISQKALADYINNMSVESALQWFEEAE